MTASSPPPAGPVVYHGAAAGTADGTTISFPTDFTVPAGYTVQTVMLSFAVSAGTIDSTTYEIADVAGVDVIAGGPIFGTAGDLGAAPWIVGVATLHADHATDSSATPSTAEITGTDTDADAFVSWSVSFVPAGNRS